MQCGYFDAGACRSCPHMGEKYAAQLAAKDARVRALLGDRPGLAWDAPFASAESGFRSKAKMVVAGTPQAPTLGILAPDGAGIDLSGCGLLGPATARAVPLLARFVRETGLRPYDVPRRTGELKQIHVTEADDGGLMVRFVMRSEGQIGRIRRALPTLAAALPGLRVASVNLLPEHKAVAEGDVEILLTDEVELPMRVGDVTLHVRPGAFVQTNSAVAAALYRRAGAWIDDIGPASVLDLYCGVGGFALHAARPGRDVVGVETSEEAVASASRSAADAGLGARFVAGDATDHAESLGETPDLVVVNPPRRGIGPRLAAWLEESGVETVVYSSCNPQTLVRDLAAMPSLAPVRAGLFDMFPHTDHAEVLTLLRRR